MHVVGIINSVLRNYIFRIKVGVQNLLIQGHCFIVFLTTCFSASLSLFHVMGDRTVLGTLPPFESGPLHLSSVFSMNTSFNLSVFQEHDGFVLRWLLGRHYI